MAKARALDKRRKSIRNIRKITRTMELVSTAQFRRAMDRAVASRAYTERIVRLVTNLSRAGIEVSHPLLEERESKDNATLLILTANRGMCGGYNSGILRVAAARRKELVDSYKELNLQISGKKGISFMKYHGVKIDRFFYQFDHKPTFEDVDALAEQYLADYRAGKLDRLEVAYSKFVSMAKQYPVVETLLPMAEMTSETDKAGDKVEANPVGYDFLPSPESLLEEIVPTAFKIKLFKCFLDSAVSEQIARMVAMKSATDNADSIIRLLTTTYNRARQSQITGEIIEVISGAGALK